MKILNDVAYRFKRLFRFTKKLYLYGKLLWDDFEFDYIYLLKIMQLKMRLMSEHMSDRGNTVSSPQKAKELKLCVDLIDRIIYCDYGKIERDKLDEKYGKSIWKETKIEGTDFYKLDIYREKAPKGTPAYEQAEKEERKVFENAERQKRQDLDYLFDTMKKRIEGWWD